MKLLLKRYKGEAPFFDISEEYDAGCITAVSANLRCFNSGDRGVRSWFFRAPLEVQTIIAQKPDIIGCQECMPLHYDYLNFCLKGYDSFIKYREKGKYPESCPIFFNTAKFELVKSGAFWLSKTPEVMSKDWGAACFRICSFVILKQRSDLKQLAVFNTHLDHISVEARINGIRLILKKLEDFGGMPCIVMGDFNDSENSETYSAAAELFDDVKYRTDNTDSGATYHGWGEQTGDDNIDYFFVSKKGINVQEYRVIRTAYNGVYPSDHYPIKTKFTLE